MPAGGEKCCTRPNVCCPTRCMMRSVIGTMEAQAQWRATTKTTPRSAMAPSA